MTYQEIQDKHPEMLQEIIIQDLLWHKLTLRNWRRNFRIFILAMLVALVASISICVGTVVSIKTEYSNQLAIIRNTLEQNAQYKNGRGFDVLSIEKKQESQGN